MRGSGPNVSAPLLSISFTGLVENRPKPLSQFIRRTTSPIVQKNNCGLRCDHVVMDGDYIQTVLARSMSTLFLAARSVLTR